MNHFKFIAMDEVSRRAFGRQGKVFFFTLAAAFFIALFGCLKYNNDLSILQNEHLKLKAQYSTLKEKLLHVQSIKENLEEELTYTKDKTSNLERGVEEFKKDNRHLASKEKDCRNDLVNKKVEADECYQRSEALELVVARLNDNLVSMKESIEQLNDGTEEIEKLKKLIYVLNEEKNDLLSVREALELELEQNRATKEKMLAEKPNTYEGLTDGTSKHENTAQEARSKPNYIQNEDPNGIPLLSSSITDQQELKDFEGSTNKNLQQFISMETISNTEVITPKDNTPSKKEPQDGDNFDVSFNDETASTDEENYSKFEAAVQAKNAYVLDFDDLGKEEPTQANSDDISKEEPALSNNFGDASNEKRLPNSDFDTSLDDRVKQATDIEPVNNKVIPPHDIDTADYENDNSAFVRNVDGSFDKDLSKVDDFDNPIIRESEQYNDLDSTLNE